MLWNGGYCSQCNITVTTGNVGCKEIDVLYVSKQM